MLYQKLIKSRLVLNLNKDRMHLSLFISGGPFLHFYGRNLPALMNLTSVPPNEASECRKDLGIRKTLRMMSRGHQFVVRAGGHIDSWTPLYQ